MGGRQLRPRPPAVQSPRKSTFALLIPLRPIFCLCFDAPVGETSEIPRWITGITRRPRRAHIRVHHHPGSAPFYPIISSYAYTRLPSRLICGLFIYHPPCWGLSQLIQTPPIRFTHPLGRLEVVSTLWSRIGAVDWSCIGISPAHPICDYRFK